MIIGSGATYVGVVWNYPYYKSDISSLLRWFIAIFISAPGFIFVAWLVNAMIRFSSLKKHDTKYILSSRQVVVQSCTYFLNVVANIFVLIVFFSENSTIPTIECCILLFIILSFVGFSFLTMTLYKICGLQLANQYLDCSADADYYIQNTQLDSSSFISQSCTSHLHTSIADSS